MNAIPNQRNWRCNKHTKLRYSILYNMNLSAMCDDVFLLLTCQDVSNIISCTFNTLESIQVTSILCICFIDLIFQGYSLLAALVMFWTQEMCSSKKLSSIFDIKYQQQQKYLPYIPIDNVRFNTFSSFCPLFRIFPRRSSVMETFYTFWMCRT